MDLREKSSSRKSNENWITHPPADIDLQEKRHLGDSNGKNWITHQTDDRHPTSTLLIQILTISSPLKLNVTFPLKSIVSCLPLMSSYNYKRFFFLQF